MATFLHWYVTLIPVFLVTVECQTANLLRYNITEEQEPGVFEADIPSDAHLHENYNPNTLSQFRYSFLPQHLGKVHTLFTVDKVTGKLQTAVKLDRDDLCPNMEVCKFKLDIAVTPAQFFQVIQVEVILLDINDNKPVFPKSDLTIQIPESHAAGATYIIPAAHDPDEGRNSVQVYELLTYNHIFDLQVTPVPHDDPEIKLVLKSGLDRENTESYELKVIAVDGGLPTRSGLITIHVKITDINDNSPKFANNSYQVTIKENYPSGTTILRVQAFDQDEGSNGIVIYNFTKQTVQHFGKLFSIHNTTGDIYLIHELDYEFRKSYQLNIMAHDLGITSTPGQTTVFINLIDVNDNKPKIKINVLSGVDEPSSHEAHVSETSSAGTFVALISVTDLDSNQNGNFTCSLDSELFKLEQVDITNKITQFKITTNTELDYENCTGYNITVQCQDGGEIPLQSDIQIKVKVKDENDHRPVFPQTKYSATISENDPIGLFVIQVNATDGDVVTSKSGELHYFIQGDSTDSFSIDENNGIITTKAEIDYEKASTMEFQVIAHDMGEPQYSTTAWITVLVIDENDEKPQFSAETFSLGIFENQPVGTEVGIIEATDKDSGAFGKVSYSFDTLKSTNGLSTFEIDSDTGRITTKKVLDREDMAFYYLVVTARDHGSPANINTVSLTIFVVDANDNAPIITHPMLNNNTIEIAQWKSADHIISVVKASDRDTGNNAKLTFSFSDNCDDVKIFKIHPVTGEISATRELKKSENGKYDLCITVQDRGFPVNSVRTNITINVNITQDPVAQAQIYESLTGNNLIVIICLIAGTTVVAAILLAAIVYIKWRDQLLTSKSVNDVDTEATIGNNEHLPTDTEYHAIQKDEVIKEVRFSIDEELPKESSFHQIPTSTPSLGKKSGSSFSEPSQFCHSSRQHGHVRFSLDPPEKIHSQCMFMDTELEVDNLLNILRRQGEHSDEELDHLSITDSGRGSEQDDSRGQHLSESCSFEPGIQTSSHVNSSTENIQTSHQYNTQV